MGLRQIEQDFSSFSPKIFTIFDDFSKWSAPKVANTYGKILAKNEKKALFKIVLNPYLHGTARGIPETRHERACGAKKTLILAFVQFLYTKFLFRYFFHF